LAERLHLYRELLATPPRKTGGVGARKAVLAAGDKLGQDLLGEAAPLLTEKTRVILAPDGALNLVPLRVPNGQQVWVRVPSATILGHLRGQMNHPRGHGLLAAAASATPDGKPLPGAVGEVKRLKKKFRGVELRLEALQPEDLTQYGILHLATHAHVDDQRPWSSEIILDASDPAGRLRARDIAELDLGAGLAVLSACETGSGRVLSGEGVLGLSSAFLSAGVPTVVASLWPVDDRATARLMDLFYDELAAGRDPASALAAAQEVIRSDSATAHPFHWAGFVVVGDGSLPVEIATRIQWRLPVVFLVVFMAAIILLRKRS
jgi:CHAT domain-containing protein